MLLTYTLPLLCLHVCSYKLDALYCGGILSCISLYVALPAAISMHYSESIIIVYLAVCMMQTKAMWPAGYYYVCGSNRRVVPTVFTNRFIPCHGKAIELSVHCVYYFLRVLTIITNLCYINST